MKENDDYGIAKPNRRETQESKKKRVVKHQTVLIHHTSSRNEIERRGHISDRKAAKRRK